MNEPVPQEQKPAAAPAEKSPAPAAEKAQPAEDFRAKYEAAAEAAKAAQQTAARLEKEHKALLKSIEDGSLVTKVLAEKLGTKQDEDPSKVLERVKADSEAARAEVQRLRDRVRSNAIKEALREVAKKAHKPERLTAFLRLDDIEVSDDGEVTALSVLRERVEKLRETDAYLFQSDDPPENKDAKRAAPLPSAAAPPPANNAEPEKPRRRIFGGITSLPHLNGGR